MPALNNIKIDDEGLIDWSQLKDILGEEQSKCIEDMISVQTIDGEKIKAYVHRKGATRAFAPGRKEVPLAYREVGQPILLPGSMGTSSYVLVGTEKAMTETFGSTAHGAGRVMSRHQALKTFKGSEVQDSLEKSGIHVRGTSMKGLAEEAPGVYKDIDEVVKVSHDAGIGKLVFKVKPLSVIKG